MMEGQDISRQDDIEVHKSSVPSASVFLNSAAIPEQTYSKICFDDSDFTLR